MSKAINIKDIAKITGYSVATISRVLNNSKNVKESTKNKILSIIQECEYYPNNNAKNLRMSNSRNILIALPGMRNPVFGVIVDGILDYLNTKGYNAMLTFSYNYGSDNNIVKFKQMLESKIIDGIIFVASSIRKEDYERIQHYNVIMCSEYFEGLDMPKIAINNYQASYSFTEYAISQGKKHIVFLRGSTESSSVRNRTKGFAQALMDHNLPFTDYSISGPKKPEESFEYIVRNLLLDHPEIDCFVIHSGPRAKTTIKVLREMNREDIMVLSFDHLSDLEAIGKFYPYVKSDNYSVGRIAAKLLLNKIENVDEDINFEIHYDLVLNE